MTPRAAREPLADIKARLAAPSWKRLMIFLPPVVFFTSFMVGRYPISPEVVVQILLSKILVLHNSWPEQTEAILFQIRLPRVLAACLVGAALAASGAAYQIIFRNPLVSPGVLGVSAGASFGAVLGLLLHTHWLTVQLMAFFCGLLAVVITLLISKIDAHNPVLILVLGGMVVTALFQAFISAIKYLADPNDTLPAITFWLMGSLNGAGMQNVLIISLPVIGGLIAIYLISWQVNVLSLSEEESRTMGVDTQKIRMFVIFCATLLTSSAVSISGIIGWVGLLIPHMARFLVGPDFRVLLPASIIMGSTFLILIDDLARIIAPVEIPLGILTAVIGAPFFVCLLKKARKQ
jgi:iron complex transport system permease protein